MNIDLDTWGIVRKLTLAGRPAGSGRVAFWPVCWYSSFGGRSGTRRKRRRRACAWPSFACRRSPALLIDVGAVAIVVQILVEPTFQNIVALLASLGLILAFALKDYGSSLVAGVVTILENTYQPGDWIEVDGAYGEVKAVGLRAVHLVTPDDTEVVIPHSRLWSTSIFNASSGNRSLLCVADFYIHPDHDALAVRQRLTRGGGSKLVP